MAFLDVVEVGGEDVSQEQVLRTHHRYYWAASFCEGKDVLEVGCGSGFSLPFLKSIAARLEAGDYSEAVLDLCRSHYGEIVPLKQFSAEDMPYPDNSLDVIIFFEAIYYVENLDRFVSECKRVLRPGGVILIATANNKLWDFTPSPYSHTYLNVTDFRKLFPASAFDVSCYGYISTTTVSARQKLLRPLKALANRLHIMPTSMAGKRWLKKLFFGDLVKMPSEIRAGAVPYQDPVSLPLDVDDAEYKVIYCAARLT